MTEKLGARKSYLRESIAPNTLDSVVRFPDGFGSCFLFCGILQIQNLVMP